MTDYAAMVRGLLGDLSLAPARAYMAQAPKAPQSMGLLGQIHNAIDPVQAFGGYGGLAAMALPPGAPKRPVLAPAIKIGDKIFAGKPGQIHADVGSEMFRSGFYDRPRPNDAPMESGFVDSAGNYLTREEALAYVGGKRPTKGRDTDPSRLHAFELQG